MSVVIAWIVSNAVALVVGAVVGLTVPKVGAWVLKQFTDAKTHLPD